MRTKFNRLRFFGIFSLCFFLNINGMNKTESVSESLEESEEVIPEPEKVATPVLASEKLRDEKEFSKKLADFYKDICKSGVDSRFDNEKNLKSLSILVSNINLATEYQIKGLLTGVSFYLFLVKDSMKGKEEQFKKIDEDFTKLLNQLNRTLFMKRREELTQKKPGARPPLVSPKSRSDRPSSVSPKDLTKHGDKPRPGASAPISRGRASY